MEYQKQDENGQLQWYTLVGDSAIPEKVKFHEKKLTYRLLHFSANKLLKTCNKLDDFIRLITMLFKEDGLIEITCIDLIYLI